MHISPFSHELFATITLQGAHTPFVRHMPVDPFMTGEELVNRICITVGRYPTPDAVLHHDGNYAGHAQSHFRHQDLDESRMRNPLLPSFRRMELILSRLKGWVFDVEIVEADTHFADPYGTGPTDPEPLLPNPAMSLAEYNAVMRARSGDPLPPDVERAVIVDELLDLMHPEVPDPRRTLELYTVLAERGRPFALPDVAPIMRAQPDLPVLLALISMADGDNPPRLGKHGYLPVKQVRKLVEKFPELHPGHYRGMWSTSVSSASEVTILSDIIELGRTVGVFTARRGEEFQLTDFGEQVQQYCPAARTALTAAIVDARMSSWPEPIGGSWELVGTPYAETFEEHLRKRAMRQEQQLREDEIELIS